MSAGFPIPESVRKMGRFGTNVFSFDMRSPKPGDPFAAVYYLAAARECTFWLPAPKDYQQTPESSDQIPVRGDKNLPAILDASHAEEGAYTLALSIPGFAQTAEPIAVKRFFLGEMRVEEGMQALPDVSAKDVGDSLKTLLETFGIKAEAPRIAFDSQVGTKYAELSVADAEAYEKGRALIYKIVHGTPATDRALVEEIKERTGLVCAETSRPKRSLVARLWRRSENPVPKA